MTYVDFLLYELLDVHCQMEPGVLDSFANLKSFLVRIESFPNISAYMKSDQFIAKPITAAKGLNGRMAAWGADL